MLVLLNWLLLVEVLLSARAGTLLDSSLLLARSLEDHDIVVLIYGLGHLSALCSESIIVWPEAG